MVLFAEIAEDSGDVVADSDVAESNVPVQGDEEAADDTSSLIPECDYDNNEYYDPITKQCLNSGGG